MAQLRRQLAQQAATNTPRRPTAAPTHRAVATGWDAAQACRSTSDSEGEANACIVRALRNASSERELALLASTYRSMGNRSQAIPTMRRYNQRYPNGPLLATFQQYINTNSDVVAPGFRESPY